MGSCNYNNYLNLVGIHLILSFNIRMKTDGDHKSEVFRSLITMQNLYNIEKM